MIASLVNADTYVAAYVPTREPNAIEVRVQASMDGPVMLLTSVGTFRLLPSVAYGGLFFYRQRLEGLPPRSMVDIMARHVLSGIESTVNTATLSAPDGAQKLAIGIIADLHLPSVRRQVSDYRPGIRRFSGLAAELGARYVVRLAELGADVIVLPGDLVDPCTPQTLAQLKQIFDEASVPCFPIIGNHEPWSAQGEALFYRMLGIEPGGYYAVRQNGVLLIMLSTPETNSLQHGSEQLGWLKRQLASAGPEEDIILFSHFSLLLHPCVQGDKNDGYQLLDNHRELLELLAVYPNVRMFVAGHKNVPSMVQHQGVIHTLSPQLIQFPCGYDLIRLFNGGAMRITYEIEEQHYCEQARLGYRDNSHERFGHEPGRSFYIQY